MSGESGNPHTGIEIGRTLRLAREKRGLSLQQVEEATKIRARYLRDLENENFDVLPTVYVVGSLKTYAEHLGLDGAAMTGELKRRQASLQEQEQAPEDPPSREPRRLVASLGRLVGIGGTVEDDAGTMAPGRRPGLYVSLVVVLIFVLATYAASTIRAEVRPSISVVQEPTGSRAPSEITLIGDALVDEPYTEGGNVGHQSDRQAGVPDRDASDKAWAARSGQAKNASLTAQVSSSSATASASATANASASAPASVPASVPASASPASSGPSTEPAAAAATVTPAPNRVRPEPAAGEQPGDSESVMAVAPTADPSTRTLRSRNPSPGFQQKQTNSVVSTPPGNRTSTNVKISTNVEKIVDSAR